ncbi:hypothetical protein A9Q73_08555 [Bermanella sp. 47_1433_sub80_T6]|nr:hypothetical protein A9Q73_08555 [Bermanella sp. 47_1433_sub80_T6]
MNPLDQLKDIHLPADVSLWPLAWPWWILIILLVALPTLAVYLRRKNRWRRQALQQLNNIEIANKNICIQQCNRLLKQVALYRFGQPCAALSGEPWLEFLDSKVNNALFMPEHVEFASAVDRPDSSIDPQTLKRAVATWIRKHKC